MLFIQYNILRNYAYDNSLNREEKKEKNNEHIKSSILLDYETVNNWFYERFMVLNSWKSHYIGLGNDVDDNEALNVNGFTIKSSKELGILVLKADNNLNFNNHVNSICRKARQKLSTLPRRSFILKIRQNYQNYQINQWQNLSLIIVL